MLTQHQVNLNFIIHKGFKTDTVSGLKSAMKWLKSVDEIELLYGNHVDGPFDRTAGELKRNMLIHTVQMELLKYRNQNSS